MIKIDQMRLPVIHSEQDIRNKIIKELNLRHMQNMPDFDFKIIRRSIDARKKPEIFYTYSVCVSLPDDMEERILRRCGYYRDISNYQDNDNGNNGNNNKSDDNKHRGKGNAALTGVTDTGVINKKRSSRNSNISKYTPVIYRPKENADFKPEKSPVIAGEGPAGLFAGLILAYAGYKPVIIERGDSVYNRINKVNDFWQTGTLDKNTNVQFGEGGAGTFSDGKLNTGVKDAHGLNQFVLDTFVKYGADAECAYDAKPHVGTDKLAEIVKNIRNEIISHGGLVFNLCKMTDVSTENGRLKSIIVEDMSGNSGLPGENASDVSVLSDPVNELSGSGLFLHKDANLYELQCDDLIIAIGHSARDTFRMLHNKNIPMQQKDFAVGLRIQHPQELIDKVQYGMDDRLPPASYKLTNKTKDGRAVFSFCMCPGGYVVNASSEDNMLCVNGMSNSKRDSGNANSAIIVSVTKDDFGSDDVLSGMKYQEELEKRAFTEGCGKIPVQLYGDFCKNTVTDDLSDIKMSFKGQIHSANLRNVLPESVSRPIIESMEKFGYTMKGFDDENAVLAGIESRTSSPVRILRDDTMQSDIRGIYPCGEGAGYAGGIMSAAIDGIKVAEAVIKKYNN